MADPDVTADEQRSRSLRWGIYWILIALAVGNMSGRILAVNSVDQNALEKYLKEKGNANWRKTRPFLSANDRSRWATVRSLVEHGTFAIDDVVSQPGWDTIDMVKHKDRDGVEHLYSSKPPLIATIMAGEYWLIHKLTGATLGSHPYEIGRFMLLTINVPAMLALFVLMGHLAERIGQTDWGRIYMMAGATFGIFLTTFAVTINNHLIAAVCLAAALVPAMRIWYDGDRRLRTFVIAGFFAAFTVAGELPALSFCVLLGLALAWKAPRLALLGYVPGALIVGAAAVGTNYIAHNSLRPPYAHRSSTNPEDNWYDYSFERDGKTRDSYWRNPQGVDKGEPSVGTYALHTLVGHHGIFSLTPMWLLSAAGVFMLLRDPRWRSLATMIIVLSLVCYLFYLFGVPARDRNYGGTTSGLRWMFWFAPLWLIALLPAADRLSRCRKGQSVALVLLALSVLSASYPTWNPWTHPWLMNFMTYMEWISI